MDKNKILDTKIIHETANFKVGVPVHPHVSREEGGHLWIMGKKNFFKQI